MAIYKLVVVLLFSLAFFGGLISNVVFAKDRQLGLLLGMVAVSSVSLTCLLILDSAGAFQTTVDVVNLGQMLFNSIGVGFWWVAGVVVRMGVKKW